MTTAGAAKRQFDDIQGMVLRGRPSLNICPSALHGGIRLHAPASKRSLSGDSSDPDTIEARIGDGEGRKDGCDYQVRCRGRPDGRGQVSTEAQV